MTFKEVTALRRAEKLDEALAGAEQLLQQDAENIWHKRAAAWVHYEFLKKSSEPNTYALFREHLSRMKELELPENDRMLFDNAAWQIGSMVFALQKQKPVPYGKISEVAELIRGFHFTKPSEAYSFIYKAFHKGYSDWPAYLRFADWWGFKHFLPADYQQTEYNGKKIMSIAEQAYIAYAKKLLEGEPDHEVVGATHLDMARIAAFMPWLDHIIETRPEYQYPAFFKAKLMLATGEGSDILSTFLPFARKKQKQFWVWDLLADIFSEDQELQFACYCKALSLHTPDSFLVKMRERFAGLLLERGLYDEAKTELMLLIAAREKEGWNIPNRVKRLTTQEWYSSATAKKQNNALYQQHLKAAEALLLRDIPEEVVAVSYVNRDKKLFNFIKDRQHSGFTKYEGMMDAPEVGQLLRVRLNRSEKGDFCPLLSARPADADTPCKAVKEFEGPLKLIPSAPIGFVAEVLIPPPLIQQHGLSHGQVLRGKAVLSFDKKREKWGWKAFQSTPAEYEA